MLFTRVAFTLPLFASAWAAPMAAVGERGFPAIPALPSTPPVINLAEPLAILHGVQAALAQPLALIKANPTGVDNVVVNLGTINTILQPVGDILKTVLNAHINIGGGAQASAVVSANIPAPSSGGGLLGGLLGGILGGGSPSVPTVPAIPTDVLKPVADLVGQITQQVVTTVKTLPTTIINKPAVGAQLGYLDITLTTLLTSLDTLLKGILVLVRHFLSTNTSGYSLSNKLAGLFGTTGVLSTVKGILAH